VFGDANGNRVLDAGEVVATTRISGTFVLSESTGQLVLIGGYDSATNLSFQGRLRAPQGSTVVTPLTTLESALMDVGIQSPRRKNA